MQLHALPRETPLRVRTIDGGTYEATFHRTDGMYSVCTLDDGRVFHLHVLTEMVLVDGRWETAK